MGNIIGRREDMGLGMKLFLVMLVATSVLCVADAAWSAIIYFTGSHGTFTMVYGVKAYSDEACTISVNLIDWGTSVVQNADNFVSIYIKNEGDVPVKLTSLSYGNWVGNMVNPTVSWDYPADTVIAKGDKLRVNMIFRCNSSLSSSFSVDIQISVSEV